MSGKTFPGVEVENHTDQAVSAYIEVEWLYEDGFRVAYGNERRKLKPGVNLITKTEMLNVKDTAKIRECRLVKVVEN